MPLQELKQAIMNVDEEKLTVENMEALVKYAPRPDEVTQTDQFDRENTLLTLTL